MFPLPIKKRVMFYGVLALGHTFFTFIFPWVSGALATWLFSHRLMDIFIASFAVPFFTAVIFYAYKKWRLINTKKKIILAISVILYFAAYAPLTYAPERLHILNFSFMGIVFYKLFSPLMRVKRALIRALLVTIFIGTLDEFIQYWVPSRGPSVHDVLLCVEAAFLGVALAWIFDKYSRQGRS